MHPLRVVQEAFSFGMRNQDVTIMRSPSPGGRYFPTQNLQKCWKASVGLLSIRILQSRMKIIHRIFVRSPDPP